MKKRIFAIGLVLLLVLGTLAGCASARKSADSEYWVADEAEPAYAGFASNQKNTMTMDAPMEMAEMEYSTDNGSYEAPAVAAEEYDIPGNMVNDLTYGENVKLIFRAWLRLQTLDFAQAEAELNKLVDQYHGYFESVYTDNGSYYSNYNRLSGSYTVRVPAENYDRFLSAVGNTCHVVNLNKTTEDVGLQYSDTQMRLETEKAKQERLLTLLKQATDMSDIIQLESAISDCQYQIDSLTSTINRYDSLIGYSTVQIELEQVERLESAITEEETFWQRLGSNFKEGLEDFAFGVQDLIIWAAYNIVGILIFVIVVILIVKVWKKRVSGRIHLPKGKKKEETQEDKPND